MDNQMAIYRADTCSDIFKHSLIAANDDYSPTELAATLEAVHVIPGAKYYLQIDGSFGGSKGTYELYFYAYNVGVDEISEKASGSAIIQVYPNPGRGIFNIIAEGVQSTNADIILFNLNGKALQRKTIANQGGMISTRMDLSMYASGIYQLLLIDGKQVANQRIIKQ
jgi:hypothetical protein